jgi:hypothetical protein
LDQWLELSAAVDLHLVQWNWRLEACGHPPFARKKAKDGGHPR